MFDIGTKYTVRNTASNQKNSLPIGKGAWITFVDERAISLTFDDYNTADMKIPRPAFGINFEENRSAPVNKAYGTSHHAAKEYR